MPWADTTVIQVAVGLILQDEHVLIAKRHAHQHQGDLWEFPGGKVEVGETSLQALKRELKEEVDLVVMDAQYLFTIDHDYPDKSVQLIIFKVASFEGEAHHCEGQELRWCPLLTLGSIQVPEANHAIVDYFLNSATA